MNNDPKTQIKLYRISLRGWLALLALVLVSWFIIENTALLFELTWILLGAFILSVMIRPAVDLFAQRRVPRGVTVLLAYALLVVSSFIVLRLLAPIVSTEVISLRQTAPTLFQQALEEFTDPALARWLPSIASLSQQLNQQLNLLLFGALRTVTGLGTLLLDLFVVLILAYAFTTATYDSQQSFGRWLNAAQHSHLQAIFGNVYQRLSRWVWAQLGLSLYHAVCFVIGLSLLQVPYAITIGLLGGLLSLIPYLGVALTAALATLSLLPVNPWLALWVVLFMGVVSIIGSHVITPVLYGRTVGLNVVIVLLALFVGAKLQGITGIIFAIPITVVLSAIAQEFIKTPATPAWPAESTPPEAP